MQTWMFVALMTLFCSSQAFSAQVFSGFYFYKGKPRNFSYQMPKAGDRESLAIRFDSGVEAKVKSRLVFQLRRNAKTSGIAALRSLKLESSRYKSGLYFVNVADPLAAIAVSQTLSKHADVLFSHPIFDFPIESRSADPSMEPLFVHQNHLHNTGQRGGLVGADINVLPAWEHTTGDANIKIALIDLGFEQDHPDLKDAWAINTLEIAGNKIDDDRNGFIDDVRGWNFDLDNHNLLYGAANSHGTATAGLIAASANGIGVTGVCPGCKVLPILIYTDIEDAAAAMYYARDQGAQVISNSWGYKIGTPETELLEQALHDVAVNSRGGKGISIIFAMPNHQSNACRSSGLDISGHPDVIAVSSIDNNDRKIQASGFGPCLKFVGPTGPDKSSGITTTDRMGNNGYNKPGISHDDLDDLNYTQSFYGTSAATPVVAGVFGLIYSLNKDLSALKVLETIRDSADRVSPEEAAYDQDQHSNTYGFGRPNAGAAVDLLFKSKR